jgi:UDP-N-acetylmuramoyl-L-alanyl-D-glutamate--2,6-diaminopimelate ligase
MRLAELFPQAGLPADLADRPITGISSDSRQVTPDMVFFAVPGTHDDGLRYVPQAVQKGAIAIVAERAPGAAFGGAAVIKTENVRAALARAAARLYPRQPDVIAAITGTSGKTSVADFSRQIWTALGKKAASIGTLGVTTPAGLASGALTTPDPVTLHEKLDQLTGGGVTHLCLEASSHGIHQRRLDGVRLAAAAFTNLSRDHLDYHPTLEDYFAAKLELFTRLLPEGRPAVIDADSSVAQEVIRACETRSLRVLSTGAGGTGLRLLETQAEGAATRLTVAYGDRIDTPLLPLAGSFQASNALVAAGLCIVTGSDADAVFAALEKLTGAPGRLELAGRYKGAPVFVDYAHKPDALEKALKALRPFVRGRLIVVFGCGGDRDAGKRPLMGEVAARLADRVIVTDDNPRSEDPAAIRKAILKGAAGSSNVEELAGRAEAIALGVSLLAPGDGLLIAGKGHETGQIIGAATLPFSDISCVRDLLRELSG